MPKQIKKFSRKFNRSQTNTANRLTTDDIDLTHDDVSETEDETFEASTPQEADNIVHLPPAPAVTLGNNETFMTAITDYREQRARGAA